jgi:uncharacterized repeat protein (TIGR02543 family)/LPXTG-motif cell wall-anchored protein
MDSSIKDELLDVKLQLSPDIDNSLEEVQIERAEALSIVYQECARNIDNKTSIIELFTNLFGNKIINPTIKVQAAVARSYEGIIYSIVRNPDLKDNLLTIKDQVSPEITDFTAEDVQIARLEVLSTLYSSIARQPDCASTFIEIFNNLLGSKISNPSVNVQAAIARSYSYIIIGIARQPEAINSLLNAEEQLSPEIINLNLEEVQIARAEVLGSLYQDVARQPEIKDTMIQFFKDYLGGKIQNPSIQTQAATVESYMDLVSSIKYMPELKDQLLEVKELLACDISDTNNTIVQASMAKNYGYLIDSIESAPDYKETLIELLDSFNIKVTNLESEDVQIVRTEVLSELYNESANYPELSDELVALFTLYLGGITDINHYTVTFNSNGGTSVSPISTYYKTTIIKPKDPIKEGFDFLGWYDGETLFDFNTPIKNDITLGAKWSHDVIYNTVEGNNQTINYEYNNPVTFRVDADITKFLSLYRNNQLVDESNYTRKSGSIIITLDKDYVKTLPIGNNTFTVKLTDGNATATLIVKKPTDITKVNTGDNTNILGMFLLLGMSIAGGYLALRKRKE